MHYSKLVDTLFEKGLTLSLKQCQTTDDEKQKMNNVLYTSAIRSLVYAMLCTWPDICFAVRLVCCYQSNPRNCSKAVKRIMCYL